MTWLTVQFYRLRYVWHRRMLCPRGRHAQVTGVWHCAACEPLFVLRGIEMTRPWILSSWGVNEHGPVDGTTYALFVVLVSATSSAFVCGWAPPARE